MGICASKIKGEITASNKDHEIDRKNRQDHERDSNKVKLLLLGAGESGKSTIFKQMRILYGNGYSEGDRKGMTPVVHANAVHSAKTLLSMVKTLGLKLEGAPSNDDEDEGSSSRSTESSHHSAHEADATTAAAAATVTTPVKQDEEVSSSSSASSAAAENNNDNEPAAAAAEGTTTTTTALASASAAVVAAEDGSDAGSSAANNGTAKEESSNIAENNKGTDNISNSETSSSTTGGSGGSGAEAASTSSPTPTTSAVNKETKKPNSATATATTTNNNGLTAAIAAEHIKKISDDTAITDEIATKIETIWNDPAVQEAYKQRSHFQLSDCAAYFMKRVRTLAQPGYIPSVDDVLHVRVRTSGILTEDYVIDDVNFSIYDVGGQKNERRKWIHAFDDVTAIIFVAAISEYDQVMFEDSTTNRLMDALRLFEEVSTNKVFANTSIILFLNKLDLFMDKIQTTGGLRQPNPDPKTAATQPMLFDDYEGGGDPDAAVKYIVSKFLNVNPKKETFWRVTCATDSENIKTVFNAAKDIIQRSNLLVSGFDM